MLRTIRVYLLILAVFLIAACAAAPAAIEQTHEADGEAQATDSEPASLLIYSGRSDTLVQPIIDRFAEQTGIDVDVRYGSTAELAGVLLEEGDRSPADLFFAQDPGGLRRAGGGWDAAIATIGNAGAGSAAIRI